MKVRAIGRLATRAGLQSFSGVLLVVAIVAGFWANMRPPAIERSIDATSVIGDDWHAHGPQKAFDGDPRTEWHSEDMTNGSIVRRFEAAKTVRAVTLLNGRNPPWLDRGADRYRIELLGAGDEVLAQDSGRAELGARVRHELGARGVRSIRFVAETFHGSSASVAELTIELADE